MLTGSFCFYILSIFLSNSLLMFFKMLQLCQFLSQKMCFTYRWGRENYFNGDQITLFVVGMPLKNSKVRKNNNKYIHGVFIAGFGGNWGGKMDMEPPYKTSLYINNLCPTHSPEEIFAWGNLRVGSFKGTYNLEEVELWAIGRS